MRWGRPRLDVKLGFGLAAALSLAAAGAATQAPTGEAAGPVVRPALAEPGFIAAGAPRAEGWGADLAAGWRASVRDGGQTPRLSKGD